LPPGAAVRCVGIGAIVAPEAAGCHSAAAGTRWRPLALAVAGRGRV